jgi:hypothetical protein
MTRSPPEEGSTYLDRARADAEQERLAGGRFKAELAAAVSAIPTYPALPENSPWHGPDPVPDEPPLGPADLIGPDPAGDDLVRAAPPEAPMTTPDSTPKLPADPLLAKLLEEAKPSDPPTEAKP